MTRLKLISLKLPEEMLDTIDEIVKTGKYASRSEFIRTAIREKIERELGEVGPKQKGVTNSPV